MCLLKTKISVFLNILMIVNTQRWYSATMDDSQGTHFGASHLKTNQKADNKPKYLPLITIDKRNQTSIDKWSFLRKHTTELPPPPEVIHKRTPIFNWNLRHYKNKTTQDSWTPLIDRYYDEKHYEPNSITKESTSKHKTPTFNINRTIQNVNVIKKKKPKRKMRRCPAVRRQRQKKQLHSNQTLEKRFLEVFQVVEFDHVPCVSSSGLEGVCLPEFECQTSGGISMGSCADGYGTCCVTQFSCDDRTAAHFGWFTNPGFPSPSTERLSCVVTIDKASTDIKQIRLDFMNLELLPPNVGTCENDQFVVSGQNVNNIIPILCGVNSGQHVYIEVGDSEGPITLSVQTVSSDSRLFSVKVTQLTSSDELAAPTGCLQYFKEPIGYLESFNYRDKSDISIARSNSYLNNLNYAMCIERTTGSCSITYTNTGVMQVVNYDDDGLPVLPPNQAGVEIFNCPTDWLLIAAVRLCGEHLNDGSVLQDFALDAPVTDTAAGPIVIWFRSDSAYVGRGFKIQFQQNTC